MVRSELVKENGLMKMTSERLNKIWRSMMNANTFISKESLFTSREFRQQFMFRIYESNTTNVNRKADNGIGHMVQIKV